MKTLRETNKPPYYDEDMKVWNYMNEWLNRKEEQERISAIEDVLGD